MVLKLLRSPSQLALALNAQWVLRILIKQRFNYQRSFEHFFSMKLILESDAPDDSQPSSIQWNQLTEAHFILNEIHS